MIGLVLATNGLLAQQFLYALEHVVGPQEQIETICIGPEDDASVRRNDMLASIARVDSGSGAIVISDMFGLMPANLAISVMTEQTGVDVISGLNLPMLIAFSRERYRSSLEDCVAAVQEAGRKYISVASYVIAGEIEPTTESSPPEAPQLGLDRQLAALQSDLESLREAMKAWTPLDGQTRGIGHNHPPRSEVLEDTFLEEGLRAVRVIRTEVAKDKPDADILAICLTVLSYVQAKLAALLRWLGGKGDKFAEALVTSAGKALGPTVVVLIAARALDADLPKLMVEIAKLISSLTPGS